MSEYVNPLRFVNTPTVMEIWEQEHTKEPKEVTPKEKKEVAEEAETKGSITGTEAYYQWLLDDTQLDFAELADLSGNESFWDTVKNSFNTFIENVKKFFKWVFSFFTSKKRMVDQTTEKLSKTIKVKGVKEGDIAYPKDFALIWNAPGKPGSDISWINGKLGNINDIINKEAKGYTKELRAYIQSLNTSIANVDKGQLIKAKEAFDKAETTFLTNLAKIIKSGEFLAGSVLEVSKNGKLLTKANPKVVKGAKKVTFKTTVSVVETVLKNVQHTNELYGEFTKEVTELEDVIIKKLNDTLKFGNSIEFKEGNEVKSIIDRTRQTINIAMSNIKLLETVIYKAINAGLNVANAAIKKDGASASDDKK